MASDPFFGRGGTLLAESQRDQRLKLEIVAPIASDERPTAIISLNYHQDHFGEIFAIRTADGRLRTRPASASGWSGWRWRSIGGTASTDRHGRRPTREALGL